jgi:hypothetical protein
MTGATSRDSVKWRSLRGSNPFSINPLWLIDKSQVAHYQAIENSILRCLNF